MKQVCEVQVALMPLPMPVRIPRAAKILHTGQPYPHSTSMEVTIWFEIEVGDEVAPDEFRMLAVYGAENYIPDKSIYLSTHIVDAGRLIVHLYELAIPEELP